MYSVVLQEFFKKLCFGLIKKKLGFNPHLPFSVLTKDFKSKSIISKNRCALYLCTCFGGWAIPVSVQGNFRRRMSKLVQTSFCQSFKHHSICTLRFLNKNGMFWGVFLYAYDSCRLFLCICCCYEHDDIDFHFYSNLSGVVYKLEADHVTHFDELTFYDISEL